MKISQTRHLSGVAAAALAVGASLMTASPAAAALPGCTFSYNNIPSTTWTSVTDCVLRQGASGEGVRGLQTSLALCYGYWLKVDGKFGPATREALKRAQKQGYTSPDGVFGPNTRRAMLHYTRNVGTGPKWQCQRYYV